MIFSNTAGKPVNLSETQQVTRNAGKLMTRKIWLPKALYAIIPYFYVVSGCAALLATLYISDWFWVLPHYLLFAGACLHMGILVYRRRQNH
jgi:fatty acid desaturase